ncbi:P-loop nucleoside triphosphate hydrolase superfamily protein [Medicago truncatula]|uniref:P-loop nucleoside triphosphate hydrolase superfamily protein n=1 Tax=Medicago truncatula TaxID=3880 RepID=A0A072VFL4_MEDTR|nr:P-loop nucleoside triphosphate hydrolase superfamily protein [Medicago truncatula]
MEHLLRSLRSSRFRFRSLPSSHSSRRLHSSISPRVEAASARSSSSSVSDVSRVLRGDLGQYSMLPAVLAGLFGIELVETAYAEEQANSNEDVQEIAIKERQRIQDLLTTKGIRPSSVPRFNVAVKGQKVSIKFQIPPGCEVSQVIANLTAHLGLKSEGHGGGSDMILRAWDSTVAWQLTLTHPSKQKHIQQNDPSLTDTIAHDTDLCILIFHSLIGTDKEIEFMKQGNLSPEELDAFISVLQLAGNKLVERNPLERKRREETEQPQSVDKSISSLEAMGVKVYGLNEPIGISNSEISWDIIAGYEDQKRVIEDTVLLALRSPEVYDDIARGTRHKFESNRPRAVLFEGPPGTGKTSCARVIANQAGVPLLYVPLEVVMSEFYGKSERLLGKVFSLANNLPNGAIIFLDEIDSLAASRDNDMHEATRRMLSVLLRQIDGFEQDKKVVVIAATNRKEDLDPALISRFDTMIAFGLPDQQTRQEIASKYAKHLSKAELDELARVAEDMAGRDIRDVCLQAERSWASKIIRGQVSKDGEQANLPPLQEYIACATNRREALLSAAANRKIRSSSHQRMINE